MTEPPQLLANVEFEIVKKGYDPEQVDNYLKLIDRQVSQLKDTARQAVEQAEVAHARSAEAQREKATYLAEVQQAKADLEAARAEGRARPAEGGEDDGTEALKKMLLLAQRTADSHVEEAQASAKNIAADARTKAAEIVAGAETRAERLLIEAQKVSDELVRERSDHLATTVAELERRRDLLRADSEVLESYLTEHRERLKEGVSVLSALLSDHDGIRADPIPALSAEPQPAAPMPPAPAPVVPSVDDLTPDPTALNATAPGPAGPSSASPIAGSSVTGRSGQVRSIPAGSTTPAAPPGPRDQRRPEQRSGGIKGPSGAGPLGSTARSRADARPPGTGTAGGSPTVVRVSSSVVPPLEPDEPDAPTAARIPDLIETPRELRDHIGPDGGPPTMQLDASEQQALLTDNTGGDLLPPVDPVTDEAMKRFFEDDIDEDGKPRRFRRRS